MKQFDRSIRYLSGRLEPRSDALLSEITHHQLVSSSFHEKLEEREGKKRKKLSMDDVYLTSAKFMDTNGLFRYPWEG